MNVLDNLTSPSTPPAQPSPDSTPAQVDSASVPPAADPNEVVQNFPFLKELQTGKISGVVVPPGWSNPATKVISPDLLNTLGLVLYHPVNPSSGQLGIFNPKIEKVDNIRKLDKKGELLQHFPSMETFVPSIASATSTPTPDAGTQAAPNAPVTPGPSQGRVDVAPMPTAAPNAPSPQLQKARAQNLAVNQAPSARTVPGGGTILNSLLKRAV
jgi:hypothetical protein